MSNKIVITKVVSDYERNNSDVFAIILQNPKEVFENHRLTLSKIATITKSISEVVSTSGIKYRLDMKLLTKEDDDFYMGECDKLIKGGKPSPVYDTIDAFLEKYQFIAPEIIETIKANDTKHKRSSPLK